MSLFGETPPPHGSKRFDPDYAPRTRAERFIVAIRVVLAALSLVAIWVDLLTPTQFVRPAYFALAIYLGYSAILAAVVWEIRVPRRLGLICHIIDLVLFPVLFYLTAASASPLFVYLVFALVSAKLRWGLRGILWTAGAVVVGFNAVELVTPVTGSGRLIDLPELIIRNVYLAAIVTLLAVLGAYSDRLRDEMIRLARWPRSMPLDIPGASRLLLEHAAGVLGAPRLLLIWEDQSEPWQHVALWSGDRFSSWREAPGTYDPIVSAALTDRPFASRDVSRADASIQISSDGRTGSMRCPSLQPDLQLAFDIKAVLCLPLRGDCMSGYLLALDRGRVTPDDFVLGRVVAQLITTSLDQQLLTGQLRAGAAAEERIRLAAELHDGVLQWLTGAALQLEAAMQELATRPSEATARLEQIGRLIADEQRDLRFLVRELKSPNDASEEAEGLLGRLDDLAERIEVVWGLKVHVSPRSLPPVPDSLTREIYRIVREGLINIARHAHASDAQVTIAPEAGGVRIELADNGTGFSFRGTYDHYTLAALEIGPRSLWERIDRAGGTLTIHSTDHGGRLEILLPPTIEHTEIHA
jgi:signal transduction histidine kinase